MMLRFKYNTRICIYFFKIIIVLGLELDVGAIYKTII